MDRINLTVFRLRVNSFLQAEILTKKYINWFANNKTEFTG